MTTWSWPPGTTVTDGKSPVKIVCAVMWGKVGCDIIALLFFYLLSRIFYRLTLAATTGRPTVQQKKLALSIPVAGALVHYPYQIENSGDAYKAPCQRRVAFAERGDYYGGKDAVHHFILFRRGPTRVLRVVQDKQYGNGGRFHAVVDDAYYTLCKHGIIFSKHGSNVHRVPNTARPRTGGGPCPPGDRSGAPRSRGSPGPRS